MVACEEPELAQSGLGAASHGDVGLTVLAPTESLPFEAVVCLQCHERKLKRAGAPRARSESALGSVDP